jgi:uncharacterized protein YcfJ
MKMKQFLIALLLLGLATAVPVADALAQSGRGAVSGAIIGGAVGGRRGAAIGATAGAIAGAHRNHRHNYYWRQWTVLVSLPEREVSSGVTSVLSLRRA